MGTHFFREDVLSWMSPVNPLKGAGALPVAAPALARILARSRPPGADGGGTTAVPAGGADGGGRRPDCRSMAIRAMGSDGTAPAGGLAG